MKYVVTIPEIVLLVVTLALFTSIYLITIPWKPVFASPDMLGYYPSNYTLLGSTALFSGSLTDLQSDNGVYMTFRAYDSATSAQPFYGYQDTTKIDGTIYRLLKLSSSDDIGTSLSASMVSSECGYSNS
jgi:hypothetical protein